jgi:hypothetical protein
MQDIQGRLQQFEASPDLRESQKTVVDELSKLIERAENQGSPNRSSASPAQKRRPDASDPSAGSRPQESAGAESSAARKGLDADERAAMLRQVWGHLPSRTREQIETPLSEQFLPKYEHLIEDYYRRLAEEK